MCYQMNLVVRWFCQQNTGYSGQMSSPWCGANNARWILLRNRSFNSSLSFRFLNLLWLTENFSHRAHYQISCVLVFVYTVGVCSLHDDKPSLFGHLTNCLQRDLPGSLGWQGGAWWGRQVVWRLHAAGEWSGRDRYAHRVGSKCCVLHSLCSIYKGVTVHTVLGPRSLHLW